MNLQQELNNLSQQMQQKLSDDVKKIMAKTAQELIDSQISEKALKKKAIKSLVLPYLTAQVN